MFLRDSNRGLPICLPMKLKDGKDGQGGREEWNCPALDINELRWINWIYSCMQELLAVVLVMGTGEKKTLGKRHDIPV